MEGILELGLQLGGLVLFAWFVVTFVGEKEIVDRLAEANGLFNVFIYPVLTCYWCASFWSVLIGCYFDLKVTKVFYLALLASFVVRTIYKGWEKWKN